MGEPTIPEILRVSFEMAQEPLGFSLDWPSDIDGQARCIRILADIVKQARMPHDIRAQAFDELQRVARDYQKRGAPGSAPFEIFSFSFGVFSGAIEQPKRGRGRDRKKNMLRNRMIIDAVAWLRARGETKAAAIKIVAEVVEGTIKARNPRLSFGPDGVSEVLKSGDPIKKWKKEIDGFLPP